MGRAARIAYGVMGDSRGHVSRSQAVAQTLLARNADHEIRFFGGGAVAELATAEQGGFHVTPLPMLETVLRGGRVDPVATARHAVGVLLRRRQILNTLRRDLEAFQPDLVISDYEYFTPRAARELGAPTVSLDHQHVITHTRHDPPEGDAMSRLLTSQLILRLYSAASRFMISSFFQPPAKDPTTTTVFPPILRAAAAAIPRSDAVTGEHLLVYARGADSRWLEETLAAASRPAIVYGFGARPDHGRIRFKANSLHGFLDDLRTAAGVVSNGGHSLLSEALHLGKPVLAFPTGLFYEQHVNAVFLERLGYGLCCVCCGKHADPAPSREAVRAFETALPAMRETIAAAAFHGNHAAAAALEALL